MRTIALTRRPRDRHVDGEPDLVRRVVDEADQDRARRRIDVAGRVVDGVAACPCVEVRQSLPGAAPSRSNSSTSGRPSKSIVGQRNRSVAGWLAGRRDRRERLDRDRLDDRARSRRSSCRSSARSAVEPALEADRPVGHRDRPSAEVDRRRILAEDDRVGLDDGRPQQVGPERRPAVDRQSRRQVVEDVAEMRAASGRRSRPASSSLEPQARTTGPSADSRLVVPDVRVEGQLVDHVCRTYVRAASGVMVPSFPKNIWPTTLSDRLWPNCPNWTGDSTVASAPGSRSFEHRDGLAEDDRRLSSRWVDAFLTVPFRWPSSRRRSVWMSGTATGVSARIVRSDPKPTARSRTRTGRPGGRRGRAASRRRRTCRR